MNLVCKFKGPTEKGELQLRQLVNSLTKKLYFTENCVVLCYQYITVLLELELEIYISACITFS